MDLNLLQTFCTVAETLNISRAAEQRHLTQPAVSLQIKQLEQLIGRPLFLRHPLRLTDTGRHLRENARDILQRWQQTLEFAQAEAALTRGSLTIACSDVVLRYRLLNPLQQFRRRYPGVKVALLNRTSRDAQQAVLNGEADLAFALHQQPHAKLVHRPLFQYQEVAAVSREHELAKSESVTAARLARQTLLLLEAKTLSYQWLMQWFGSRELVLADTMALGSVDAQLELAALGLGVALVPEFTVPAHLQAVQVRGLPVRQVACFYQHLKPAAQAWLRLPELGQTDPLPCIAD